MTMGISVFPALWRTMQGEEMLQSEEVAVMLRLHELGEGVRLRPQHGGVGICARAGLLPFAGRCGELRLTVWMIGCGNGFSGMAATRTWCARSWRASTGS